MDDVMSKYVNINKHNSQRSLTRLGQPCAELRYSPHADYLCTSLVEIKFSLNFNIVALLSFSEQTARVSFSVVTPERRRRTPTSCRRSVVYSHAPSP